jgi:hypothetical protein
LRVDTRLLPYFEYKLRSTYTFIGELQVDAAASSSSSSSSSSLASSSSSSSSDPPPVLLRARVARDEDGTDMVLFEQALALRRRFLATSM